MILSENITVIPDGAFEECTSLQIIEIPNGVRKIGFDAFHGCSNLKEIIIPSSVEEICKDAFEGCNAIIKRL